ncbi:MAG TPA: hypothetical protein VFQ35_14000, partial [Polyangiaceae bacterium]|nr:hypothetical protein [Polyangiaceae bacterium]
IFFVFLTELARFGPLSGRHTLDHANQALSRTVRRVRQICDRDPAVAPCTLTLMATDGETLVATHGGKELFVSTYKKRCVDRDRCASLSAACEGPSPDGRVNHIILSSEPLHGENVWVPLEPGELIGVGADMRPRRQHIERCNLPLAG